VVYSIKGGGQVYSNARPARSPLSIASKISASTLTTAVSTEWCGRWTHLAPFQI